MSILLVLIRLPLLILIIIVGLITIVFFPNNIESFRNIHFLIMMKWMKCLSYILGIKIKIIGNPDVSSSLYVSNHVTYLDIIVINQLLPVNFIAKDEISKWPIIGNLASKTGTLFIKRGDSKDSSRMITEMKNRLALGNKIVFFPEGKIGSGESVKKFHHKLFKSIDKTDINIQPIAIRYPRDYPKDTNYSRIITEKSEKGEMMTLYFDFLMKKESHVILHFLDSVCTRDYIDNKISNDLSNKINDALRSLNS